jgi:di/tricarboxylate transporter
MPPPDPHAIAMLVLTGVALVLFTRERFPLELSSLILLVILTMGFALFPYEKDGVVLEPTELFFGLGHEALVAVCALMVVGQGLVRTGALEPVGRVLGKLWTRSPLLSFLLTLVLAGVLSAFMNNTPIVVLLLPILISVSLRTRASPSGILMPMGFATLVGGMSTTIGTSTNLLVVTVAADLDAAHFKMFDFAVPAAVAAGVGILYLWLVAPRILPTRDTPLTDGSPRLFDARILIPESSPCVNEPMSALLDRADGRMQVQRIRRGDTYLMPLPDALIQADDVLMVRDTPQNLKDFESALDGTLFARDVRVDEEHPLTAENQQLAEVAVVQGSPLDNSSVRNARFIRRYQVAALAVHRAGRELRPPREGPIIDIVLRPGDILLVQGAREQIEALKRSTELLVLDATLSLPRTEKSGLALAIIAGVVLLAASGLMSIAISAVAGATLMLVTRCLGWGAAIRAISPSVFFVVVASLALGHALVATGGTAYLTGLFVSATQDAPAAAILAGLMGLMAVLTNIVSNNAAAVIGTPIAVGIAAGLTLPVEPFVLAVLFGANMSYATPMAYKTNLLVMSAGNYSFGDFLKVGIPLTVIMWIVLSALLTYLYL